jgi:hypothetical protein
MTQTDFSDLKMAAVQRIILHALHCKLELILKNIFQIGVQFEAILIYPGNFNDNFDSIECIN